MEGKEKLEKIIAPRPRASPQAPFSETNILLDWFLKRLSIERDSTELPELLGPPRDPFNFTDLRHR